MNKIYKIILFGYIALAFFGAFVLSFDVMRFKHIDFIDLLFTSTSALSVTGLVTANISTDFTIYGQIIIALLIQIGGFGFMSIATLILIFMGKKVDFTSRKLLQESLVYPNMKGIISYIKKIVVFILIIETIGAVLLSLVFWKYMDYKHAIFSGIFHAISAFNNAGFSIFSNSLMDYRSDFLINIIITSLIILGGLGFLVMSEFYEYKRKKVQYLSLHTKVVLIATIFFIIFAMILILLFEWNNDNSIGKFSIYEKLLSSYFMSINFRTSGFNTIDLSTLHDQSIFFSSIFMIVGAAPGGTAGGIKITTVVVLLSYAYFALQNKELVLFKRGISDEIIKKAFLILIVCVFYIIMSVMILSAVEDIENENFLPILFEISSAFGTVGLSLGDGGSLSFSATFSEFGKLYMISLMFLGRVGVLMFSFALFKSKAYEKVKYPKEDVML